MQYIKNETNPQVIKLMCRQLKEESVRVLDLYLPQICYLILQKDRSTKELQECIDYLEKLVIDISIRDMNIGLRTFLYFNSWQEDKNATYSKLAEQLSNHLEASIVTKKRP